MNKMDIKKFLVILFLTFNLSIMCIGAEVTSGETITLGANASDEDCHFEDGKCPHKNKDEVTITWSAVFQGTSDSAGTFPNGNTGTSVQWTAPTVCEAKDVTITATADDSGNMGDDEPASDTTTVTVVSNPSCECCFDFWLAASEGTEYDDGDANDNTRAIVVDKASSGYVTINVYTSPPMTEEELPSCWSLTGGSGSGKLARTVSKTSTGEYQIKAECGSKEKTLMIFVTECNYTVKTNADQTECDEGWFPIKHGWWRPSMSESTIALRKLFPVVGNPAGWANTEAGYYSSTGQPIAPGLVASDSGSATATYTDTIPFDYLYDTAIYVGNLSIDPGTYNLLTHNCIHETLATAAIAGITINVSTATPCALLEWINNQ